MRKKLHVFFILLSILLLVFAFENCSYGNLGNPVGNSNSPSSSNSNHVLPAHNYLTTPPPDVICGADGYKYLMDEYLTQHCSGCHDNRKIAQPTFVDPKDPLNSYYVAKLMVPKTFKDSLIDNEFCGDNCSLEPEGEVYKAIEEWLENQNCK